MTMLREEIGRLIKNIERELLEFVKYVRTIEEEYTKYLPLNEEELERQALKNLSENRDDFSNSNGIYDAIEIAKVMVQRIYNLLDDFSNAISVKEKRHSGSCSYLEKYFYNQYVCQVLAYLLKILEENISIFSGELIQTGERRPHTQCNVSEQKVEKIPLALKFAFFKPATLFTEDGKECQSASSANYKPEAKSSSNCREFDRTKMNGTSSKEGAKCNHSLCLECFEREKKKNLMLNSILKSIHTLVEIVEELLSHFKNSREARTPKVQSSAVSSGDKVITPDHEAKSEKEAHVLKEFIQFCESCKTLLKNPKYKNVQVYKEYEKENPTSHQTQKPKIHAKLYRMEPEQVEYSKHVKEKVEHFHNGENPFSHIKHIPGTSSSGETENRKEQGNQDFEDPTLKALSDEYGKDEAIPDSSKNNQSPISKPNMPVEESKIQSIKRKSNICASRISNSVKKLQNNSNEELTQLGTKTHYSPEIAFPVLQHSTSNKATNTNYSSSNSGDDDAEIDEDDVSYPQMVVFDIKKFTHLFTEKFKKTKGRTKSKELLNIAFTSFKESSDFKYEAARRSDEKISQREASVEKAEDFELKADKAVDTLVDEVISVATKAVLSEHGSSKKLHPRDQESHVEEDEHFNRVDSDEYAKHLYPEHFRLNKKFLHVTQACISCLNMKESITTDLYKDGTYSDKKDHGKKSLTDTCFQCLNTCQRGLTIHQCHFTLPSGVLEIRHMDDSARILVCFLKWDISKEPDDWRWQKNPFPDPTRVEIQQPATYEMDPILKVVYGPEGTMVKESFGETRLRTLHDFPKILANTRMKDPEIGKIVKSDSMTTFKGQKIMRKLGLRYKKPDIRNIKGFEFQLFNKLSRFYDDIQRFGYGRGPPLILKLRKNYSLNDAYDLLMAPSKVRLHYYRNIRVIFLSDDNSRQIISKSNFVEEDRSNELFDHFARKLFGTEAFHLFDYPSEEAHYMYLNPDTHTHPQWFAFAGTVLALAFMHQKKMDIKLSSCLFKCLLDRPLVIKDLQSIDPLLYQKLMWLKENDLSRRKANMTFTIRDKVGNKTIDTDLMVNGRNIAVTEKNKFRYIELAVKWKLAERCLTQLKDFRRGFASVVDPCFLSMFKENELLSILKHPPEVEVFLPDNLSAVKSVTRRGTW